MSFARYDKDGNLIRHRVVVDCQKAIEDGDEIILTEQNHKGEVDINNIVSKHGLDLIAQNQKLVQLTFDENPNNDFQEMMNMLIKGQEAFMSLPANNRAEFNNNPAEYMDYVMNPENRDAMIERGWIQPAPVEQPIEVVVTNPETPPDPPPAE